MPDQKISALTSLTSPVNADIVPIVDTSETETKQVSWENIKATLKIYFDSLYAPFEDHKVSHQNGGNDEISVAGLSGQLADEQDPVDHAGDHENTGGDEISVTGLSGVLADDQHVIDSEVNALIVATKLDDLATPDDNIDLDATTGRHGLLPKLGGGSVNFLRADGTWVDPAAGGSRLIDQVTNWIWLPVDETPYFQTGNTAYTTVGLQGARLYVPADANEITVWCYCRSVSGTSGLRVDISVESEQRENITSATWAWYDLVIDVSGLSGQYTPDILMRDVASSAAAQWGGMWAIWTA